MEAATCRYSFGKLNWTPASIRRGTRFSDSPPTPVPTAPGRTVPVSPPPFFPFLSSKSPLAPSRHPESSNADSEYPVDGWRGPLGSPGPRPHASRKDDEEHQRGTARKCSQAASPGPASRSHSQRFVVTDQPVVITLHHRSITRPIVVGSSFAQEPDHSMAVDRLPRRGMASAADQHR